MAETARFRPFAEEAEQDLSWQSLKQLVEVRRLCSLLRLQEMIRDQGRDINVQWSRTDGPAANRRGTSGSAAGLSSSIAPTCEIKRLQASHHFRRAHLKDDFKKAAGV